MSLDMAGYLQRKSAVKPAAVDEISVGYICRPEEVPLHVLVLLRLSWAMPTFVFYPALLFRLSTVSEVFRINFIIVDRGW